MEMIKILRHVMVYRFPFVFFPLTFFILSLSLFRCVFSFFSFGSAALQSFRCSILYALAFWTNQERFNQFCPSLAIEILTSRSLGYLSSTLLIYHSIFSWWTFFSSVCCLFFPLSIFNVTFSFLCLNLPCAFYLFIRYIFYSFDLCSWCIFVCVVCVQVCVSFSFCQINRYFFFALPFSFLCFCEWVLQFFCFCASFC